MPYRESVYTDSADRFDVPELIHQLMKAWKSIPQDQKSLLIRYIRELWPVRGALLAHLVVLAFVQIRRGVPMRIAVQRAAQKLKVEQRVGANQPGMSTPQVQQYRRRQMQRLPTNRRKPNYRPRRW